MNTVIVKIENGVAEVVHIDPGVNVLIVDEDVSPVFTLPGGEEVTVESYNDDGTVNVRYVDLDLSSGIIKRNVPAGDLEWLEDGVDKVDSEVVSWWGEEEEE